MPDLSWFTEAENVLQFAWVLIAAIAVVCFIALGAAGHIRDWWRGRRYERSRRSS